MSESDRRPGDHLTLGVDFGTVCRRCGARLLDETTVALFVVRSATDPLAGSRHVEEYRATLCAPCAEVAWPAVHGAARAATRREGA